MRGWAIMRGGKFVGGTLASTRREAWIAFNEYKNRWQLDWHVMLRLSRKAGYRAVPVAVVRA